MSWPWKRRPPRPSDDAAADAAHAGRALTDARNLHARVVKVARESAEIQRVNHIAIAVAEATMPPPTIRGV